jgi:predicted transcriptional regulator
MKDLAPAFAEEDFRLPETVTEKESTKQPEGAPVQKTNDNNLKATELTFLKDIKAHPESGVAERYKRLGISVRQGQKIKQKLVEKALITDTVKTTKTGRKRKIELTEKAAEFLKE